MKYLNSNHKAMYIILVVLVSAIAFIAFFFIQQANAFSSEDNVDTIVTPVPPTPGIDFLSQSEKPVQVIPQRSISKIIDLAKGLPPEDIFVYLVLRADGKYEEYYIPATYSGDEKRLMNLKPNDTVVTGYPLKPMLSTPVLEVPNIETRVTALPRIESPYPPPANIAPDTSIRQPYP